MDSQLVFSKTDKGREEIETRTYHLPQHLRIVLILVDGASDVAGLQEKAGSLPDLEKSLESLAIDGFIAADDPTWQPAATGNAVAGTTAADTKTKLVDLAVLVLGKDAEKVVNKLREAPDTREGLEAAVDRCYKIVNLIIDEGKASELKDKCAEILREM